jgi:hypothetical protein
MTLLTLEESVKQMNNINPYDYRQNITESMRAYATAGICALGLSGCITGMVRTESLEMKLLLASVGTGVSVAGRLVGKTGTERSLIANDWQDVSDAARTSHLAVAMAPRSIKTTQEQSGQLATAEQIKRFDWQLLATERDKYPHLMLLGSTGDGKTVLAENLAGLLGGVSIGAVPHWERGDYESLGVIVGQECNYGVSALPYADEPERGKSQNDEPEIPLDAIINRRVKPSICQFLRAVYNEMVSRFQLDPVTNKRVQKEPLTIVLDEYMSYAKKPGVNDIVMRLVREARKVGIRLVLLVQGNTVASLGFEGSGDIRENLTYIYLKDFAIEQARLLKGNAKDEETKLIFSTIQKLLETDSYPTLVEKTYAIRPPLGAFVTKKTESNLTPSFIELPQVVSTPVSTLPNYSNSIVVNNSAVGSQTFDDRYNAQKALWNVARQAVELGKKRSEIIKTIWGYKSERYTLGTELWRDLESKFGSIIDEPDVTDDNG